MNENMLLGPSESILHLAGGSHGKLVGATRVFTTVEEFLKFARQNANISEAYPGKNPGDVVSSYTQSWGAKKGHKIDTILVRPGHHVSIWGQLYVASPDKPPKRFNLTAEMLGYVTVKTKTKTTKPSV
jgi:hypothetical protein